MTTPTVTKIICGKLTDEIPSLIKFISNDRLQLTRYKRNFKTSEAVPISTNGKVVTSATNTVDLSNFLPNESIYIVLTFKEKFLLLKKFPELAIVVFEESYPVFKKIRYSSNPHKTYNKLDYLINDPLVKNNDHPLTGHYSNRFFNKISFTLKEKSKQDAFFYHCITPAYQEHFKLKEFREDRVIIALDFNSMFLSCMSGGFIDPLNLEYINFNKRDINKYTTKINPGFYRVILKNPKSNFIKHFHPFQYIASGNRNYFSLDNSCEIELLLSKDEINYYKRHFSEVFVFDGFSSKTTIPHPLYQEGLRIYRKRVMEKREDKCIDERLSKLKLVLMHSATNKKNFRNKKFLNIRDLLNFIDNLYGINLCKGASPDSINYLNRFFSGLIEIKTEKSNFLLKYLDITNSRSVYSFSSEILSRSRIKVMRTLERFLKTKSVEICYINIDSIHLSINKSLVDDFMERNSAIISDKLGFLKVETIAKNGTWFGVGRYWLLDENKKVLQYKNTFFNREGGNTFSTYRKLRAYRKNSFFSYCNEIPINLYNQFSVKKKIKTFDNDVELIDFLRYDFYEVKSNSDIEESYSNEVMKSQGIKTKLFNKISSYSV